MGSTELRRPCVRQHRLRMLPAGRGRQGRERTLEGEEGEERSDSTAPSPSSHIPWPWGPSHVPHPREHLGGEARVGEGREVRDTGSNLGQASQGADLTGPSILVFSEADGVRRIDGGVLVKEVVGSQKEAHTVAHCHCVWHVL